MSDPAHPVDPRAETAPVAPTPVNAGGETAAPPPERAKIGGLYARALRGLQRHEEEREPEPAPPAEAPARPAVATGQTLGRYVLGRQLGRGGMGTVFEAQDPVLGRRVAIKVLRGGAPAELVDRFQVEARAVARLKHPNIVGLHEIGTEGEEPYLVMELVEGESLAALLAREGPRAPREAAELAAKIADALYAAHGQSILHRDVKPANVLLEKGGRPLLGDFGLAKEVDAAAGLTDTGQAMGTPAYMSPEQAQGQLDRLDRRTDIYSLGVLTFEMLTGRVPFQQQGVHALIRAILDVDPPPPSKLRPGLDRDLETVVLRCLEKEPERRYGSAAELAEDLRRWLRDEPIAARRPGGAERAARWLRRNRAIARALGVTVAVALAVIVAGTAAFTQRLRGERDRAATSARETREALTLLVAEVRDKLEDVPGEKVRAARVALLRDAARRMLQLEEREGRDADTLARVVEAHRQLGLLALEGNDTQAAQASCQRAVELARELPGAQPGPLVSALHALAQVAAARRDGAAELALAQEALALAERSSAAAPEDPAAARKLAKCCQLVGVAHTRQGALDAAQAAHERALALVRAACARGESPEALRAVVGALTSLAEVREQQGELALAGELLREAVATQRRVVKLAPGELAAELDLAQTLSQAGQVRLQAGDLDGARAADEEALAIRRRLLALDPTGHAARRGVACSLIDVALALEGRGERAPALAASREAASLFRALLAQDPSDQESEDGLITALLRQATQLRYQGEHEPARASAREVVALLRERPAAAANARWLGLGLLELGSAERAGGDARAARAALEEALPLLRASLARAPKDVVVAEEVGRGLNELGFTLAKLDEPPAAREPLHAEALRLARELLAQAPTSSDATRTATHALLSLAGLAEDDAVAIERFAEAERLLRAALARTPDDAQRRRDLGVTLLELGKRRQKQGDAPAAVRALEEAAAVVKALLAGDPTGAEARADARTVLTWLGDARNAAGDVPGAGEAYREAAALAPAGAPPARELVLAGVRAGAAASERQDLVAARESYEEALRLARARHTALPADPEARRDLSVVLLKLSEVVRGQGDPARGVAVLEEAVELHAVLVKDQPAKFTDEHGAFTEVLADARRHLALLEDEVAPASPEEAITQATLFVTAGDHAGGVRAYRVALASEAVRADLAGRALFHAACCAAIAAGAEGDPGKRDGFADEAIAWLQDDLRRRREQLAVAEGERVSTLKAELEQMRELVRSSPELAPLRSRPGFAALLE